MCTHKYTVYGMHVQLNLQLILYPVHTSWGSLHEVRYLQTQSLNTCLITQFPHTIECNGTGLNALLFYSLVTTKLNQDKDHAESLILVHWQQNTV